MRIGIDLDDTICETTKIVKNRLSRYAKEENLNPLDIVNDEVLKKEFFSIYLEDIYRNVEVKKNAKEVLKRLKNKGNEIYIITARSNKLVKSVVDVLKITKEWLAEKRIIVDEVIIEAYGEKKKEVCEKYKIDIMIDDDPYNIKQISLARTKGLLFDDMERFELKNNYVTSWLEAEMYIERNR